MIRPIKRLGQNFLRDPNTARKIVASLRATERDPVVEIGPGTGALTGILAQKYPSLTAIEVDPRAAAVIREAHPGVTVLEADVLDIDWHELAAKMGGPLHVIGNLPYYITSQILFGLMDAPGAVREAVVMMQYEVAARLVATPSTKAYGILSVMTQLHARTELLFPVSRNVFVPKPDVRSAVVRLDFSAQSPAMNDETREQLRKVVRTAFNQRRKILANSLSPVTEELARDLPDSVASKRAEELSPDDFVLLTTYLHGA